MVACPELFLIDATFLLEDSERAFLGAPLLRGVGDADTTVPYGVARGLLRLRRRLGIGRAAVIIGEEGCQVASTGTVEAVRLLLTDLQVSVLLEPRTKVGVVCRGLASEARWVVTRNPALMQLASDELSIILPQFADEVTVIEPASLLERHGVAPVQVPSYIALTEGAQPLLTSRQAIRVLEVHGDLRTAMGQPVSSGSSQVFHKLQAARDHLLRRLAELEIPTTGWQLPGSIAREPFIGDTEESRRALRTRGFWSLVRWLPSPSPVVITGGVSERSRNHYRALRDQRSLVELDDLAGQAVCAVDTEATDKDPRTASLLGVSFSIEEGHAVYVPLLQHDLNGVTPDEVRARLQRVFSSGVPCVGHNLKYDSVLLEKHGIKLERPYFDTMLAAFECFGDLEFYNLGAVTKKLLGRETPRFRDIVVHGQTFRDLPFRDQVDHACTDADMTLRLYHRLRDELAARDLERVFLEGPMKDMSALKERECDGVPVNLERIAARGATLETEAAALRAAIMTEAGMEFDPDSLRAVTKALFKMDSLSEEIGRRPLSASRLEQLAGSYRVARLIVRFRKIRKRINELDAVRNAVRSGRVCPVFNQIRASHGAVASTDPDLREAVLAGAVDDDWLVNRHHGDLDPGKALAFLLEASHDPALAADIGEGRVLTIDAAELPEDLRHDDVLVAALVEPSDTALCRRLLIDQNTVVALRRTLETRYRELFAWIGRFRRDATGQGFASFGGRRKYVAGLRSSNIEKRMQAQRTIVRWLLSS